MVGGIYFAGRGGMLGDVGPEVVSAAFGWFEPAAVAKFSVKAPQSGAPARRRGEWPKPMRCGVAST